MKKINNKKTIQVKAPMNKVDLVPPGLVKISRMAVEEIKKGGIPSVIIDNCLKIAKSKDWPENINLNISLGLIEHDDKKIIAAIIDDMRKPQKEGEKVIVDYLRPVWVSKQRKVVKEEVKPVTKVTPKKYKKVTATNVVKKVPTIIIKKHRTIEKNSP